MTSADLHAAVGDRPGWTTTNTGAEYRPVGVDWHITVAPIKLATRTADRWHCAVIDAAGAARYSRTCWSIPQAIDWAENTRGI